MSIANGTFDSASDTEGCAGGNLSGSVCGKCGKTVISYEVDPCMLMHAADGFVTE